MYGGRATKGRDLLTGLCSSECGTDENENNYLKIE